MQQCQRHGGRLPIYRGRADIDLVGGQPHNHTHIVGPIVPRVALTACVLAVEAIDELPSALLGYRDRATDLNEGVRVVLGMDEDGRSRVTHQVPVLLSALDGRHEQVITVPRDPHHGQLRLAIGLVGRNGRKLWRIEDCSGGLGNWGTHGVTLLPGSTARHSERGDALSPAGKAQTVGCRAGHAHGGRQSPRS